MHAERKQIPGSGHHRRRFKPRRHEASPSPYTFYLTLPQEPLPPLPPRPARLRRPARAAATGLTGSTGLGLAPRRPHLRVLPILMPTGLAGSTGPRLHLACSAARPHPLAFGPNRAFNDKGLCGHCMRAAHSSQGRKYAQGRTHSSHGRTASLGPTQREAEASHSVRPLCLPQPERA